MYFEKHVDLNLHLFEMGTSAGGAAEGVATEVTTAEPTVESKNKRTKNPLQNVKYGKQEEEQQDTTEVAKENVAPEKEADPAKTRNEEFEKLIKGDYKDLFDQRIQQIVSERFKETKTLQSQIEAIKPILDLLSNRHGVDPKDLSALSKAVQEDDAYFENEAASKGITVEQLKENKKLELENAQLKAKETERLQQEEKNQFFARCEQEAREARAIYPGLDFAKEISNVNTGQRFFKLIHDVKLPVQTAYEVIHFGEIMGGAMQYTAQQVQKKTVDNIRANGMRPIENGASGTNAAVTVKKDPKSWTKKDREEVSRQVARGATIRL